MSSYLLRAFLHRHIRGSTPQIVISTNALVSPQHFVGWSPTDTAIAIGTSPNLSLRDLTTGATLRQWKGGSRMAWSPDGSALLTHSVPDVRRPAEWTFQIRDARTGDVRCTYEGVCGNYVYALAWSPDGSRIAHCTNLGHERPVCVWDARSGTHLVEYRGHDQRSYVDQLAWSPDSTLLVSSDSPVPAEGTTQLWQSADGTLLRQFPSRELWGRSSGEAFVYRVKHVMAELKAAAPKPLGSFWEVFSQQYLTDPRFLALLLCGAWSPDGHHLALIDGERIILLNWRTGTQERTYGGHLRDTPYLVPPKTHYGPRSLSWSPDGRRIASIDVRGCVHIWPVSIPFPWLPWPKAPVQEWT